MHWLCWEYIRVNKIVPKSLWYMIYDIYDLYPEDERNILQFSLCFKFNLVQMLKTPCDVLSTVDTMTTLLSHIVFCRLIYKQLAPKPHTPLTSEVGFVFINLDTERRKSLPWETWGSCLPPLFLLLKLLFQQWLTRAVNLHCCVLGANCLWNMETESTRWT